MRKQSIAFMLQEFTILELESPELLIPRDITGCRLPTSFIVLYRELGFGILRSRDTSSIAIKDISLAYFNRQELRKERLLAAFLRFFL